MEVRLNVETTTEAGGKRKQQILRFNFPSQYHGDLGLKLEHSNALLEQLQLAIIKHQIEEISDASRSCPCCGRAIPIHDYQTRMIDTRFGRFPLRVPRRKCFCMGGKGGSLSPLAQVFRDRVTPELKLLQAELGARHSFREAARILETFLPCAKQHNTTIRIRLGKIAEAIANETPPICESQKSHPLTVFIDGAYVRCKPEYQKRHLDVVVGKIETHDMYRRLGLSPQAAASPVSQLRRDLDAQ